jgi:hypothetical protein
MIQQTPRPVSSAAPDDGVHVNDQPHDEFHALLLSHFGPSRDPNGFVEVEIDALRQ